MRTVCLWAVTTVVVATRWFLLIAARYYVPQIESNLVAGGPVEMRVSCEHDPPAKKRGVTKATVVFVGKRTASRRNISNQPNTQQK